MKVTDFAELQSHYTGACNKRKWVITDKNLLEKTFKSLDYSPSKLAKLLRISYATIKRLLYSANLWNLAKIKKQNYISGRKRTVLIDKFGYRLADAKYDRISDRGELTRRHEHHIIAEKSLKRNLLDKEVVHHIDLDKLNNNEKNLFVCKDNKHHRELHGQLERIAGEAVRIGIIKFHPDHGYYLDNKIGVFSNESD